MTKTILIVEDDVAIRENLKEILEMENYSVLEAENGKVALDALSRLTAQGDPLPFVILLDLNMPVMSGREFLIAIRSGKGKVLSLPIIVMTAVPHEVDLGTVGFLKKPIDLDALLGHLNRLNSHQVESYSVFG